MNIEKIFKEFGVTPHKYLSDVIMSDDYKIIPISPRIDATCGGGIREGAIVLITGNEKLGKSTFCLKAAASAQNIKDGKKRIVFYFDIENKIERRDLAIDGLNTDEDSLVIIGSSNGELLTAETIFQMIEKLVATHQNCIFIIDSMSMLLTESELTYTFDKTFRSDAPRATSIFLRKIVQALRPSKNTLFCILQKMANQNASGPMAPQNKDGGGRKVQYVGNYKFDLTYKEAIKDKDDKVLGNKVHFKCVFHPASDVDSPESHFYHTFGVGVDEQKETIELAKECGLIQGSGAWFKFDDQKIQGFENLIQYFRDNPKAYKAIQKSLKEVYESKDA
jgi:recombination protein RecA